MGTKSMLYPVADPDIQIRRRVGGGGGGGGGHPDPEIRGRPGLKKKCFSALQASVWSKNEVEGRPRAPPLNPPLLSPTNSARNSIISKK